MLLILVLVSTNHNINAQKPRTFVQADSLTYALYLSGDWDRLIKEGRSAIDQGFDYYYLRMRLGYAYYVKGQYRMAIPHYKKAFEFNQDSLVLHYLFNSCEFGGRANDALQYSRFIKENQSSELRSSYNKPIRSFAVFYSFHNGLSNDLKKQGNKNFNLNQNSIQKTTNYFNVITPSINHRIGKSILINHAISYMNKNENAYWIEDNTVYDIPNQTLKQWNYNLQAQISLWGGLSILPSFNYTSITIPPANKYINTYKESYWFRGIKLQQDYKNIQLGISYADGEANQALQKQYGGHFTWFFKGNLNLYYSMDGYFQQQSNELTALNHFIHKHKIGFKATNGWWIEATGIFPKFDNLYDIQTGILYNGLESISNVGQLNNYFLTRNRLLTIVLNIGFYQNNTEQVNVLNTLDRFNEQTYNAFNITGGLIWKL